MRFLTCILNVARAPVPPSASHLALFGALGTRGYSVTSAPSTAVRYQVIASIVIQAVGAPGTRESFQLFVRQVLGRSPATKSPPDLRWG